MGVSYSLPASSCPPTPGPSSASAAVSSSLLSLVAPRSWLLSLARNSIISVLQKAITTGYLEIQDTDGSVYRFGEPHLTSTANTLSSHSNEAVIQVVRDEFWFRVIMSTDLGFSEAYIYGDILISDLPAIMNLFLDNTAVLSTLPSTLSRLSSLLSAFSNGVFGQSKARALANVVASYDQSNDLFKAFLSKEMMYSCALWGPEEGGVRGDLGPFPCPSTDTSPDSPTDTSPRSSTDTSPSSSSDASPYSSTDTSPYSSADTSPTLTSKSSFASINLKCAADQGKYALGFMRERAVADPMALREKLDAVLEKEKLDAVLEKERELLDPVLGKEDEDEQDKRSPANQDLESAQLRKIHYVLQKAGIKRGRGQWLFEVGSGWAGLAIVAAKEYGCTVHTLTLSLQQQFLAQERVKLAGLEEQVFVHLMDYRDALSNKDWEARFDAFVSVEMLEHVGAKWYDTYFKIVDYVLKPKNATAVVSASTFPESRYTGYQAEDFMRRYMWPNSCLPSASALVAAATTGAKGRLVLEGVENHAAHYPRTLRTWARRLSAKLTPGLLGVPFPSLEAFGAFERKWRYFFAYAEAGFLKGWISCHMLCFVRESDVSD